MRAIPDPVAAPATLARLERDHATAIAPDRRRRAIALGLLGLLGAYLVYVWNALDFSEALSRARLDRAEILALDSYAYKFHATLDLRDPGAGLDVTLEGKRYNSLAASPGWIEPQGAGYLIDLGQGWSAEISSARVTLRDGDAVAMDLIPGRDGPRLLTPPQDWMRVSDDKIEARPDLFIRMIVTRNKIETHRYFRGWENFWFGFNSPLAGMGPLDALRLAISGARIDPDRTNLALAADEFWNNPDWQHGEVFNALFQTVLMAVIGTALAAFLGLPLAFVAASNVNPLWPLRATVRRLFDLLRGVDQLIWSLIFIRAFGLGPLSGIFAIFFTDTGTLGKLFSEAIENADRRQMEGVEATGASTLQRHWFGVIPQILPVFVSQSLYYLESNTRSATIIGALGAGGIGLKLLETLRTGQDWENTAYMIILIVLVVIAMDNLSGWLRHRLIHGRAT